MFLQKNNAGRKFSANFFGNFFVFVICPSLCKNGTDTPPSLGDIGIQKNIYIWRCHEIVQKKQNAKSSISEQWDTSSLPSLRLRALEASKTGTLGRKFHFYTYQQSALFSAVSDLCQRRFLTRRKFAFSAVQRFSYKKSAQMAEIALIIADNFWIRADQRWMSLRRQLGWLVIAQKTFECCMKSQFSVLLHLSPSPNRPTDYLCLFRWS